MEDNFTKFDSDKLRYDLIPPEINKSLAEVITYGANKYSPNNWKKCTDLNRFVAAILRHLESHRLGNLYDKESGILHINHVMANASFISYLILTKDKHEKDYYSA